MKKIRKRTLTPQEKMLKKYQNKLTREAIIKSLVLGLIAGFLLSILVSIISFATSFNALWIALTVWGVASAGFTALFYFKVFRTTLDKTAARVDGIGLEERVITMLEFAESDNILACKQRQDTADILTQFTPKHVKFGGLKLFVIFASILCAIACAAILMMSFSTVQAVKAENAPPVSGIEEEGPLSEEDKIIKEMIEELRKVIDEANVSYSLKQKLHGLVDDLEASLKPEDSLEVKIAKISETSQLIHKLLQQEIEKSTIPDELEKHEYTEQLGKALNTGKVDKVTQAFDDMYASISVLASEQKYIQLQDTAKQILQSIEDAEEKDEELAEVLEKLAQAFLDAIKIPPPPPPSEGEEDRVNDELDQAVKDAIEEAKDAIQGAMQNSQTQDKSEVEGLDKDIQDIMQDAMNSLGSNSDSSDDETGDEEEDGVEDGDDEEEITGPAHPSVDGDIVYDSVIDGETPYDTVYDEYYAYALELLTSGNLTDEQRQIIENYFNLLN